MFFRMSLVKNYILALKKQLLTYYILTLNIILAQAQELDAKGYVIKTNVDDDICLQNRNVDGKNSFLKNRIA